MDYKASKGYNLQRRWSKVPLYSRLQDSPQMGFKTEDTKKSAHQYSLK